MRKKHVMASAAVLALALAVLGAAASDPTAAGSAARRGAEPAADLAISSAPAPAPIETGAPPVRPSPLMLEIQARLEQMRAEVAELESRIAGTRDAQDGIRLQLAVEAAKTTAEVDVLRLQADHARRERRLAEAAELDAAIEALTSPRPTVAPAPSSRATGR